jgi:hypothetical protein
MGKFPVCCAAFATPPLHTSPPQDLLQAEKEIAPLIKTQIYPII